jgi:hypothetical protein
VQRHAADELHVVVPQAEGAHRGLADQGEGLGHDLVELQLTGLNRLLPGAGLLHELLGGQALGPGLQAGNLLHQGAQLADLALGLGAEQAEHALADSLVERGPLVGE